jgi:hypothetical protein
VKRAWENESQRKEIIEAVAELQQQLRNIAGSAGGGA